MSAERTSSPAPIPDVPLPTTTEFLRPGTGLRELGLLLALGSEQRISQHALGRSVGMSAGRVNRYLRDLEDRGLVRRDGETNRTMRYGLTEAGRRCREDSLVRFCGELVRLYGHTKIQFREVLKELSAEGLRRLVLYGAAETCEMVCAARVGTDIEIVAVVDGDPDRIGSKVCGYSVRAPEDIPELAPDAVLVTCFGAADEIYASIEDLPERGIAVRRLRGAPT